MADPMIQERVTQLSPEYREFVLSDYAEKTAKIFGEPLGFNEDTVTVFENGITLFLLFFISQEGLVQFLVEECGANEADAKATVAAMCGGLPEGMAKGLAETYRAINGAEKQNSDTAVADQEEMQFIPTPAEQPSEEAQTEDHAQTPAGPNDTESSVSSMRTMEEDMERIHGYGAYRKLYPDAPGGAPQEDGGTVHALPQDEMLKRPSITETPSYRENPNKEDS